MNVSLQFGTLIHSQIRPLVLGIAFQKPYVARACLNYARATNRYAILIPLVCARMLASARLCTVAFSSHALSFSVLCAHMVMCSRTLHSCARMVGCTGMVFLCVCACSHCPCSKGDFLAFVLRNSFHRRAHVSLA